MTTDPWTRLVAKEAGAGGGDGRRGRTKGPRRRPPFIAHVAEFWDPETTAKHLAGCRTGRDADGEWRPWEELDEGQRWSLFWEMTVDLDTGRCVGGQWQAVEVP
jgi:hypothetical protein